MISLWHDRTIVAGADWAGKIDERLNSADIILLLVSPDFVNSEYCFDVEMTRALERHARWEACVIPVILRPVDWSHLPFNKLLALPTDGKPATGGSWRSQDQAFLDVARGIRRAVLCLRAESIRTEHVQSDNDSYDRGDGPGTSRVTVRTDTIGIELTIDRDFHTFTDSDKERLLDAIKNLLEINTEIKVVRKRPGSVKLTLRLAPAQAEQLLWATKSSKLEEYRVVDARLVELAAMIEGLESLPICVGRYRVQKRLGRSEHGEVFQCYDETLCRHVAVRMLPPRVSS